MIESYKFIMDAVEPKEMKIPIGFDERKSPEWNIREMSANCPYCDGVNVRNFIKVHMSWLENIIDNEQIKIKAKEIIKRINNEIKRNEQIIN